MMPTIFLDFDGVLNGHEWCHLGYGVPRINQESARCLHAIVTRTSAKVIVCSTWGRWITNGTVTAEGFTHLLASHGISCPVIDGIDASHDPAKRSKQIKEYAERLTGKLLCIDDMELRVNPIPHVRPHPGRGLEPHHVSESVKLLT